MFEIINEWELVETYCQTKNKSVVYFRNPRISLASETKQQQVWDWYADFAEEDVLTAMKTMGTWDMVVFDNLDVAIANASAWFPANQYCPDEDYYWECHVIGPDGDFEWRNRDLTTS